jgi:hypothetical protein
MSCTEPTTSNATKALGIGRSLPTGTRPSITFPQYIEEAIQKQVQKWKEAAAKQAESKREPQAALEQEAMMEEEVVRDQETCCDQCMVTMAA